MIGLTVLMLAGAETEPPARAPHQIVCALTGDCGGQPGGERPRRPREASFDARGLAERSMEAQYARLRAASAKLTVTTVPR